jgi:CYTH domain-containing protein
MRVVVGSAAYARSDFSVKIGVCDAVEVATYNGVLVNKIRLAVKIVNVVSSFGGVGIEVNRGEPRCDSFDLNFN